ncbi:ATP-dependent helicase C-terminal domain-containing protein, partial [Glycomyces endophyticus]|uniref:ATP-dependent helicase C-terminal domain-containing protein n=1 Tax=Glycomyces endophyticus TaxID=480996 RepID=UPI0031DC084D
AGREGPGAVWRCWSEAEHLRRPAQPVPDVAAADLTAFRLQAACWGTPVADLALPGPPPAGAVEAAEATLQALGAIDDGGSATERGRVLARAGLHPRLARALVDGAARVGSVKAAEVAALLGLDKRGRGDDLLAQWRQLRAGRDREWEREVKRLSRAVSAVDRASGDDEAAATVVALAFPERVAKRSGGQWLTAGGTGAVCADGSALAGSEWLAIADAARDPGRAAAMIRAGVPIDGGLARELVGERREQRVEWDRERRDVSARSVRMVGAIEDAAEPIRDPDPALVGAALLDGLREEGLGVLKWTDAARRLRERMAFCHREIGDPWPDVADAALLAGADWLEPWWGRARRRRDLERIEAGAALRNLVPWSEDLERTAPVRLRLDNGTETAVDYASGRPVVSMKLQLFFGAAAIPPVAGVPVQAHLLDPAGRPLAVTADLASFWRGPYLQVRKEMRGRYPKHPWPEDPVAAAPTAWTNARLRRG